MHALSCALNSSAFLFHLGLFSIVSRSFSFSFLLDLAGFCREFISKKLFDIPMRRRRNEEKRVGKNSFSKVSLLLLEKKVDLIIKIPGPEM